MGKGYTWHADVLKGQGLSLEANGDCLDVSEGGHHGLETLLGEQLSAPLLHDDHVGPGFRGKEALVGVLIVQGLRVLRDPELLATTLRDEVEHGAKRGEAEEYERDHDGPPRMRGHSAANPFEGVRHNAVHRVRHGLQVHLARLTGLHLQGRLWTGALRAVLHGAEAADPADLDGRPGSFLRLVL